ncbi:hypothetical protein FlaCF_3951 [Flavobacterium tructae]
MQINFLIIDKDSPNKKGAVLFRISG